MSAWSSVTALFFSAALTSTAALGHPSTDGDRLVGLCKSNRSFVEGYVAGFLDKANRDADAAELIVSRPDVSKADSLQDIRIRSARDTMEGYCIPNMHDAAARAEEVCQHLAELEDDDLQMDGSYLAKLAFRKNWPCKP